MVFRESLNAIASQIELVDFRHNRFESHGSASFSEAKGWKTSDGLLSSEDLKEEKVGTTPT